MATRAVPPFTRPMPPDFPEMFVLLGHKTIEDHYAAGIGTIKRWMREYGEEDLIQLRRGYLRKLAAANGRTTSTGRHPGIKFGGFPEMCSGDPALAFMPVRQIRRPWRGEVWVPVNGGKPKPDEFASAVGWESDDPTHLGEWPSAIRPLYEGSQQRV